jgi:hypothetical protein
MNAFGICYGVFAPITTEVAHSALVYGTPEVFLGLRQADLKLERADGTLYGDNILKEFDNGIVSGTFTMSATGVTQANSAAVHDNDVTGTSPNKKYRFTSNPTQAGGFGYIKNVSISGVKKWVPYWIHKLWLGYSEIPGATKEGKITFTSPVFEGPIAGVQLDSTDDEFFVDELEACSTYAAAKAVIDGIAGVDLSTVATPTADPVAGAVADESTVTLACTTAGATIYYTNDGSAPTSGSMVYSTPLVISYATTIKAIAVKAGMANSNVLTAAYTISA